MIKTTHNKFSSSHYSHGLGSHFTGRQEKTIFKCLSMSSLTWISTEKQGWMDPLRQSCSFSLLTELEGYGVFAVTIGTKILEHMFCTGIFLQILCWAMCVGTKCLKTRSLPSGPCNKSCGTLKRLRESRWMRTVGSVRLHCLTHSPCSVNTMSF